MQAVDLNKIIFQDYLAYLIDETFAVVPSISGSNIAELLRYSGKDKIYNFPEKPSIAE